MNEKVKELARNHGGKAALGLNAAAIIWLYSTFVPMSVHRDLLNRFERSLDKLGQTREEVATLKAANEYLMNLERKKYE